MKLFELDSKWNLHVSENAWGLSPFKKLLKKDKSKDKEFVLKQMLFIWFLCDVKSYYQYITNRDERIRELIKDVELPKNFKIDDDLQEAIEFYEKMSVTTSGKLLKDSMYIADRLSTIMKKTIDEDTIDISDFKKVTDALKQIPDIILALEKTEKAVLKEQAEKKTNVGSQEKNMFEDGLL